MTDGAGKPAYRTGSTVLFGGVVLFCLVLVAWWVYFQVRETARLEELGQLIPEQQMPEALRIIDAKPGSDFAEVARRRRTMLTSESIVLGALLLSGVVVLYRSMLRERRLREEQERFLTGATHHLKTPLATVKLGIESLLAGSLESSRRQHYLEAMLRDVNHLEGDLTNLLTAGAVHNDALQLHPQRADLAIDVEDAVRSMQNRSAAADIPIRIGRLDHAEVERDAEAIHLILHNLLDNAVKYSSPGGTVTVDVERDHRSVDIVIRDEGTGIPADELPRIFDRFYRGTYSNHLGGTGIGLHLVQELANAHSGTVTADSGGKEKGSCFRVTLPLATGDRA